MGDFLPANGVATPWPESGETIFFPRILFLLLPFCLGKNSKSGSIWETWRIQLKGERLLLQVAVFADAKQTP